MQTNIKINIYDLLNHLEKRRAMYLGNEYTFQSLDAFLTGFSISADKTQYISDMYNDFSDFNIWLLGHLPKHFGQSGGWHWQISNRNQNDDENAFKEFFEFVKVFKSSKKNVEQIKIKPFEFKKTEFNIETKTEIEKQEIIDSIHKITLENSKTIWLKGYHKKKLTYNQWCLSKEAFADMLDNLDKGINNTF
ncbi:hypothetical protein [Aquimarina algiphila]|uniref:hypothetical protein n=1 Tax=Aquimarina algiphila TaxID=2047982 RepID=UPI00232F39A3|nr:hypothetical protein [Aquimarina algiphila]